jgi:BirA family biotin operon repressor/biotin-[acetyl-CoA-carboxylase] ligase
MTMLCGLAAADAVTASTGLPVALKWPNDLLIHNCKMAGLLGEALFQGDDLEAVVVGLGINVNVDVHSAPSFIAPATSLHQELGHPVDRLSLLVAYLDRVAERYERFKQGTRPFEEWSDRLVTIGQNVTARFSGQSRGETDPVSAEESAEQSLSGLAHGVDEDGALLLRTPDGIVHRLMAADISLSRRPTP